jgi:hypothetical protein
MPSSPGQAVDLREEGEALGHRGFLLLCAGYTVCGFQIMFISVHFPAYLIDQRMTPETGMMALALIGLFNILGSYAWGWLGGRHTKKYLLAALYFTRSAAITVFILLPEPGIGIRRRRRVPRLDRAATSGVIAQVFGVKYRRRSAAFHFCATSSAAFWGCGWRVTCSITPGRTSSCGC